MKIIFFGTPQFVVPILEILLPNHDVVAIVTTPDKKVGRKQIVTPSPVKKAYQTFFEKSSLQKRYPLNIFTPDKLDEMIEKELKLLKPDIIVTAAYGKIIPQAILDIPTFGAINVHPSLLPKYRGPSPLQQTLLNGDKITGVTIIKMDDKMDHGPLLATEPYEVHETDTFETLANHLFEIAAKIIPQLLEDIESGSIKPMQQDDTKATFTKILTKETGYFDITNPPDKETLERMTRAYYPWPTAWTKVAIKGQEKIIKFFPSSACHPELASGSFCLQIEGKKPMSIKDFLNGYPELTKVTALLS